MTVHVTRGVDAWEASWESERANALSEIVVESLHDLLDEADRDGAPALVLRGGVRHFASGFDLEGLAELSDAQAAYRFLRIGLLLDRLASAPFLTVAVARGAAIGAGADLVAACDRRLALASVRLAFPGSRFGVVLGTHRLAALVGSEQALGLAGGRRVSAGDAGFLDVYDDWASLGAALDALLESWAQTDPAARPALLVATRPERTDAGLAALARSLRPGLVDRIVAATSERGLSDLAPRLKEYA